MYIDISLYIYNIYNKHTYYTYTPVNSQFSEECCSNYEDVCGAETTTTASHRRAAVGKGRMGIVTYIYIYIYI